MSQAQVDLYKSEKDEGNAYAELYKAENHEHQMRVFLAYCRLDEEQETYYDYD
jgi:hypothetical protein